MSSFPSGPMEQLAAEIREQCLAACGAGEIGRCWELLDRPEPGVAFSYLLRLRGRDPGSATLLPVEQRIGLLRQQEPTLPADRTMLLVASLHALERLPRQRLTSAMQRMFLAEIAYILNPPHRHQAYFSAPHVRYHEMADVLTFIRFPGGQLHWNLAGIPLRWFSRSLPGLVAGARTIALLGGRDRFWETHLNDRRKHPTVVLESEGMLSYYRLARCLEQWPEIRGMTSASWFFCRKTLELSPGMRWCRSLPESGGAYFFEIGHSAPNAGFQVGSKVRRELYEKGEYRPMDTCCIWPRSALIDWANRHPELEERA